MSAARSTGVDGVAKVGQQQLPIIAGVLMHDSANASLDGAYHPFGAPIGPRGMGARPDVMHVVGMEHGSEGTCKLATAVGPDLKRSAIWSQHVREEPLLKGAAGAFL